MAGSAAQVIPFPSTSGRGIPANDVDDTREDAPRRSVAKLRKTFINDVSSKAAENAEAAQGERYFHSVQYSEAELKTFAGRGQPPIVFNRIKRKVNTVCGILEKLPMGPKASPRTPNKSADDGATICTQALLYAMGWQWNDLAINAARRCTVRGIAGAEMVLLPGPDGEPDVGWDEVDQRDFFYDARSTKPDFSDARHMGTTRWVDLDEAIQTWPDYEAELQGYVEHGPVHDYERGDERGSIAWISKPESRVRIVDHWYMVGSEWHYCIYCGTHALEWGVSPYTDERNRSVHKFEMFSYEVDQDGDRYGIYRDLKGAQDEINHRRSKALHQLNSRRVIAEDGAVDDVETARRELARVDGWVVKNPGKELITEDAQAKAVVDGNLNMLAEAKAEIDTYGPNPGLIGTDIPADSGVAIQLLQAAGIAEMGTFIVQFRHWRLRCYRKTWNTIQQVWTGPRWIKVTDNEKLGEFVQLNGWQRDETGRPVVLNQLSALDMDIMIDQGPDAAMSMKNSLDNILALKTAGVDLPPAVYGKIVLELSPLPSDIKLKITEAMDAANQENPMEAQVIQMKLQEIEGKIGKLTAETAKLQSEATKTQAEAMQIMQGDTSQQQVDTPADLAKARLDMARAMQIEAEAMRPEPVQAPPPPPAPGLFEVNMTKAEENSARAEETRARTMETMIRARKMAEAPAGMTQTPTPRLPAAGN